MGSISLPCESPNDPLPPTSDCYVCPPQQFDRKPLEDRLPLALGFLGIVSLPFIVGLIYLYTNK
jgi:hypothetical protein